MASGGQKTLICPLTIFALSLLGFLPRGLCPSVVTPGSQITLRCLSETVEGGCLTPRSSTAGLKLRPLPPNIKG